MMKLPKELEGLEEPKFILMPPVGVQYGFLLVSLVVSVSVFVWLGYCFITEGGISDAQAFLGIVMVLPLIAASSPSSWKRWASFACDRKGIYLCTSYKYLFKPWHEVSGFYTGYVRDGGRYEDVIVKVRMSDEERREVAGNFASIHVDEDGFSHIGLGQQMRSVSETLQSIQKVRILSGN